MKCPRCGRPNPVQNTARELWCWNCTHTWTGTLPEHARETEPAPEPRAPKTVTISLAPVDTHQAEKIGRQVRAAVRARIATYTWAWVEREADDRALEAARPINFDRHDGETDAMVGDVIDWFGVASLARLWQWLGAE